jgi:chromosome segregation protein
VEANLGRVELPEELTHQLRLSLGDDTVELPRVESVPPGLSEQVRQLRIRLRRLGAINPDAPREYEHLLDRQTFLEAQKSDLRGDIASLHEVIEELDSVIERDFGATVRAVDASFSEYFGRLFGGGHAKLVLTDPDDLSKTGVDIVARPPGKKPQNLSLLSGGERALTAVALLFALLKANPVPFCCLDEVDAALDEANVQRFRALLEEHTQHTQFVIITHNRHTVDAASTIYGISMSERGVSQSISLKLPERRNGSTPGGEAPADGLPLAATPAGGVTG